MTPSAPRERLFALEQFGIKLGLDNINRLLERLDRPERAFRSVHVAGTNGKGSVTAMVERALRAAGHRTGRFTSPHLTHVEERIAIDGQPVAQADFDQIAADVLALVDRLQRDGVLAASPTFFEATTAMAFEGFRRAGVSTAVVEVGLGGRFDATNVITPDVSVITSIALDHERHLGSTLGAIAFEKAGIIKPSIPVVVGTLPAEAFTVVRDIADAQHAPVVPAGEDLVTRQADDGHPIVALHTPVRAYPSLRLGLAGRHQVGNAAVAARTLEICSERGITVPADAIVAGLTTVEWPARLEWIAAGPGRRVLLDAAHNPAGAAAFAEYVAATIGRLPIVLAIMKDKDVGGMVRAFAPAASRFVATRADTARSRSAQDLLQAIAAARPDVPAEAHDDAIEAVARALAGSPVAAVAGSIFLVGPIRAHLLGR